MSKESRVHHSERHYSRKGGHLARSNYWKEVQTEQRHLNRRRGENEKQIQHNNFSPLIGGDVFKYEDGV